MNKSATLVLQPTVPDFVKLELKRQSKTGAILLEFVHMNEPCAEMRGIENLYPSVRSAHSTIFKFLQRNNEIPVKVVRYGGTLFLLRTDINK